MFLSGYLGPIYNYMEEVGFLAGFLTLSVENH